MPKANKSSVFVLVYCNLCQGDRASDGPVKAQELFHEHRNLLGALRLLEDTSFGFLGVVPAPGVQISDGPGAFWVEFTPLNAHC